MLNAIQPFWRYLGAGCASVSGYYRVGGRKRIQTPDGCEDHIQHQPQMLEVEKSAYRKHVTNHCRIVLKEAGYNSLQLHWDFPWK